MTMLGGSLMRPEVEAVMAMAGRHFVSIPDLEVAAGKRITEMLKLPDGYGAIVTSGAAAAMHHMAHVTALPPLGISILRNGGISYARSSVEVCSPRSLSAWPIRS